MDNKIKLATCNKVQFKLCPDVFDVISDVGF